MCKYRRILYCIIFLMCRIKTLQYKIDAIFCVYSLHTLESLASPTCQYAIYLFAFPHLFISTISSYNYSRRALEYYTLVGRKQIKRKRKEWGRNRVCISVKTENCAPCYVIKYLWPIFLFSNILSLSNKWKFDTRVYSGPSYLREIMWEWLWQTSNVPWRVYGDNMYGATNFNRSNFG